MAPATRPRSQSEEVDDIGATLQSRTALADRQGQEASLIDSARSARAVQDSQQYIPDAFRLGNPQDFALEWGRCNTGTRTRAIRAP